MTETEALDYLSMRANAHGITTAELVSLIPDSCSDCMIESATLVKDLHISHIYPQSTHPHLASDVSNMFLESPEANMSRGAEVALLPEIEAAKIEVFIEGQTVDSTLTYDQTFESPLDFLLF